MTKKKEIVVIGSGGHASVLLSILQRLPQYEILGYFDFEQDTDFWIRWLGSDDAAADLLKKHPGCAAAMGIGKVTAKSVRWQVFEHYKQLGYTFPAITAPTAYVAESAQLGEGAVIVDRAVVQVHALIGRLAIVNTGAIVEHDCDLGDDVHIASGATLSGSVRVESGVHVGAGAVIRNGVFIKADSTIGMGAAVVTDCAISGTYLGVPAKRVER